MPIAIVDTLGIPPHAGGFATMAMEPSGRLADPDRMVTMDCLRGATDETRMVSAGVRRRFVPMIRGLYTATVTHTASSMANCLVHPHESVLIGNTANAVFSGIPRVRGSKVTLNVDGIERQRATWGRLGRTWHQFGEHAGDTLRRGHHGIEVDPSSPR